MADLPTPKFKIGDTVYYASLHMETRQLPCPDCLGTQKWTATSPAGDTFDVDCPRCSSMVWRTHQSSLKYAVWAPTVQPVTIGFIRASSALVDRPGVVEYMESTTGSGSVYSEDRLFKTTEEAVAAATITADERNLGEDRTPARMTNVTTGLRFLDALAQGHISSIFHATYSYNRLMEELSEIVSDSNKDRPTSAEAFTDVILDIVRSEEESHDPPQLLQLFRLLTDHPDLGKIVEWRWNNRELLALFNGVRM